MKKGITAKNGIIFALRVSAFTVSSKDVQMKAILKDHDELYVYEGTRGGNGNIFKLSDPPEDRKILTIDDLSGLFDVLQVTLQYADPDYERYIPKSKEESK